MLYVHWHEGECLGHVHQLEEAGCSVVPHWSMDGRVKIGELPGALVVSLDRLPSHGRAVAEWFVEAKSRRECPLVFVGGKPEKVKALRREFVNARFCARNRLLQVLKAIAGQRGGDVLSRRSRQADF